MADKGEEVVEMEVRVLAQAASPVPGCEVALIADRVSFALSAGGRPASGRQEGQGQVHRQALRSQEVERRGDVVLGHLHRHVRHLQEQPIRA